MLKILSTQSMKSDINWDALNRIMYDKDESAFNKDNIDELFWLEFI
jgi:hypothetical protein